MDPTRSEHAVRRDVAARAAQVERPARRARLQRERRLEDDRRRQELDGASQGLPAPQFRGRIGIDVSRSNPNVVYAFIDNYETGACRRAPDESDAVRPADAAGKALHQGRRGLSHRTTRAARGADEPSTTRRDFMDEPLGTYGWVFGQIRVDPKDENTIYTLGSA